MKTIDPHYDLIALVERLQEQVAGLKAANEELQRQLAESQRGGKRQAAPFSKGKRSSKPRRPGRKPDMGLFGYRKPPSPDEVTEPVVEVAVSVEVCPGCGGRLEDELPWFLIGTKNCGTRGRWTWKRLDRQQSRTASSPRSRSIAYAVEA